MARLTLSPLMCGSLVSFRYESASDPPGKKLAFDIQLKRAPK
jgi:hypothetical protein